ncbi:uncharacterized protein TRUGW13939_06075 [Talaromyces rugulosus]|uniref:Uncharacterized protein n=1 Tax=Talaromyces rugulosus TaxID=121627 RepID=A0A7H8QYA9_TALRU|nr:uncharacterized protein TRUGW13939_06075 [Talaromyces rugulosus]QKX58947.1 hypothetical protein TRUGW13939_06075 [Talaromyces rugulosus]
MSNTRWTLLEGKENPFFILTTERFLGKAMDQPDDVRYQHTETAFEAVPHQEWPNERSESSLEVLDCLPKFENMGPNSE